VTTTTTPVKVLSNFFNHGDGKRSLAEFQKELKALKPSEKNELARLAAIAMDIDPETVKYVAEDGN
jgi:hypothetical protein